MTLIEKVAEAIESADHPSDNDWTLEAQAAIAVVLQEILAKMERMKWETIFADELQSFSRENGINLDE